MPYFQVPYKASSYVEGMLTPIKDFIEEHKDLVDGETRKQWIVAIVKSITDQYVNGRRACGGSVPYKYISL